MSRHARPELPGRTPADVTAEYLRLWKLPEPDRSGDKEMRGTVAVIGGTSELPGAVILSGTAALRAGAGKLQMGTARSIATAVGVAVPEAYVFGLREKNEAEVEPRDASNVASRVLSASALLVGPGFLDIASTKKFVAALIPKLADQTLVLDAGAMHVLRDRPDILRGRNGNVVLTPHAGEMANMLRMEKDEVVADPLSAARRGAQAWHAVVALKGAQTYVVTPGDEVYCWQSGGVGLATSGSGDTLAGVIAGLLARGVPPVQAAVWGVYLHGQAGNILAERVGPIGFLARELLAEIPNIMAGFDMPRSEA